MHMQGEPRTMQKAPHYVDVVKEVKAFLRARAHSCESAGFARQRIAIDPGFGFGKTQAHNLELLRRLDELGGEWPLAVGLSRKSMVARILGRRDGDRLAGSVALAVLAVLRDALIIRAHDVAATVDALQVVAALERGARHKGRRQRKLGRKYFGTDGVRGRVGEHPMTVDFALNLASAAARVLAPDGGTVLIGKDTRLSGYMFESALEAGFVAAGVNAMLIGPLPTPGVAYMTRRFECDFGAVISASHNLYDDNGIKFFDSTGAKLSDDLEERIELEIEQGPVTRASRNLGRATRVDRSRTYYQEFCTSTMPEGMDLSGLEDRHRLRQRRCLQGRPAHAGGPGRGDRAGRLLAERSQHQRRLRFNPARPACR
jgi:hypothetical protein